MTDTNVYFLKGLAKNLFNPKGRICSGTNWDNLFKRESRLQHYQQQQVDEWIKARQYDTLKRSRFPLISAVYIFVFKMASSVCHLVFILMFCWVPCSALSLSLYASEDPHCVCAAVIGQLKWSDRNKCHFVFSGWIKSIEKLQHQSNAL